jgi:hypothetical protein
MGREARCLGEGEQSSDSKRGEAFLAQAKTSSRLLAGHRLDEGAGVIASL